MGRKRKLVYNTVTSLTLNFVMIVCGFILPRYFLIYYGSTVNGLVNSISQFLGYITLMELGLGAVVKSALYKPLANNDKTELNKILKSASNFYTLIAKILVIYVSILALVYPHIVSKDFDYVYTVSLILILSIDSFAQYYFGITNQLLLQADQKAYIPATLNIVLLVINTVACVFFMTKGYSVQIVKLLTALIFLIRPIFLWLYVKKYYKPDLTIELTEEPIKQKWNGIAQHFAAIVLGNTDIAILTIFSGLKNVSIYAIYSMIVAGIRMVIYSLGSGIDPILGSMIAKKENKSLNNFFNLYEWLMHNATVLLFSVTMVLITDFVKVYTKSVTDVNYYVPVFAILLTIAFMTRCIQLPYNCVIHAAGHFKETQTSAIIEPIINLVVSVALVFHFGLVGVAIGTIVAITYRMFYLAIYLTKHIMQRPLVTFLKYLITDSLITYVIYYLTSNITAMTEITYYAWAIRACKVFSAALAISAIFNFVFYNKLLKQGVNYIFKKNNLKQ